MSNNPDQDPPYEPPTKEFIENSLLYGLSSESDNDKTYPRTQRGFDDYPDLRSLLKNTNRFEKRMIQFAYQHKRRIKSIPWLGNFAISVKRYLITKNLSKEQTGIQQIDLSGIMGLEVNDFIWQLYMLALGRPPDDEGWKNTKYLLCSGAPKEAVVYMVCTSKEFANRTQVANLDKYKTAFWRYRLRQVFRRLPVIGWIWAIAAIPKRIFRLEVEERIRHVDSSLIDRQRFETLFAELHSLKAHIAAIDSENTTLRENYIVLFSQHKSLQSKIETINTEINAGFNILTTKTLDDLNTLTAITLDELNTHTAKTLAGIDVLSAKTSAALQIANQNIINANEKLDETGIFVKDTANRNRPIIYSASGGVTVVQTKEYILGVPSEEWRLSIFLSIYGFFELGTEKYYRSILKAGMNVVDVGAYLGIYSLHALAAGCSVYTYEPTPRIYNILVDNIGINGFEPTHRAHLYNFAVSDHEGIAQFSIRGNGVGQMNSFYASNPDDITIEVKTISLDAHLGHLDHVDIAKIDAEGAEPLILMGMKGIVAKSPNIKIIMEFAPAHLMLGGKKPLELIEDIHSMGLEIHLIHEETGDILDISDDALCAVDSANVLLTRIE